MHAQKWLTLSAGFTSFSVPLTSLGCNFHLVPFEAHLHTAYERLELRRFQLCSARAVWPSVQIEHLRPVHEEPAAKALILQFTVLSLAHCHCHTFACNMFRVKSFFKFFMSCVNKANTLRGKYSLRAKYSICKRNVFVQRKNSHLSGAPNAPGGRVLLERDGGPLGHILLAFGARLARLEHGACEDAQPEAALLERAEVAERHGHAVRRGAHRRHEAHEQRVVCRIAHDAH